LVVFSIPANKNEIKETAAKMEIGTFQRVEKKYLMSRKQYIALTERLLPYMHQDAYGKHTISNLYFDTPDDLLVRRSIEKPMYKEKLRLRSYGIPKEDSQVFLEIKKKYDGIVYKRRIAMTLQESKDYIEQRIFPADQGQIFKEIDYLVNNYEGLAPKLYLAYDRRAWAGNEADDLRITFDTGIRSRWTDLHLEHGDYGTKLLDDDKVLMEIKVPGAFPLWMTEMLTDLKIYPTSFSKYGNIYKNRLVQERDEHFRKVVMPGAHIRWKQQMQPAAARG
jgi:hypothetical protein